MSKMTKEQRRRWAQGRYDKGLCIRCGKPNPDLSRKHCPDCLEEMRVGIKKQNILRAKNGLCVYCGENKALPGKSECGCYTQKVTEMRQARYALGLCIKCGKNPIDKSRSENMCDECLDKLKTYRKRYNMERSCETARGAYYG